MKRAFYLAAVLLSVAGIAGCGENGSSTSSSSSGALDAGKPLVIQQGAGGAAGIPSVPKEARFTIHCYTYSAPNHPALARQLKDELSRVMGGNFYVIQKDQSSTVYYGFYASNDHNTPEGRRAQEDLNRLRSITDSSGQAVLDQLLLIVPLESPDPTDGNQAWDLAQLPKTPDHRYFFSLEIAAFQNNPQRKEAAVQMAKDLRDHGIEAYYYHGPSTSSVTLGVWPMSAVKKQEASSGGAQDPSESILVATALPQGYSENYVDRDGNPVRAMVQKIEVEDPSLLAMMRKYSTHAVNYQIPARYQTEPSGEKRRIEDPSFLVICPQEAADSESPSQAPMVDNSVMPPMGPAPVAGPPIAPPNDGSGHLRSLGD